MTNMATAAKPPLPKLTLLKERPNKTTNTVTDTIEVTVPMARSWKKPRFQRPLKSNQRLLDAAEKIKADGVILGTIHLGQWEGDTYLIDGQHRVEAFFLTELKSAYADVTLHHADSESEMAEVFRLVNTSINPPKPDDMLRAMEPSIEGLRIIRKKCPFVGYGNIGRGEYDPILSMAKVLRSWTATVNDTPSSSGASGRTTAVQKAEELTVEEAEFCAAFLGLAFDAWRKDTGNVKLWGALNLTLCAWLYRRLVMTRWSIRTPQLTNEQFRTCLFALSENAAYIEWLRGRNLGDRDRPPAYARIKAIFVERLLKTTGIKHAMPAPEWAKG